MQRHGAVPCVLETQPELSAATYIITLPWTAVNNCQHCLYPDSLSKYNICCLHALLSL